MVRIKICGLTTPQDAAKAIEFGADALGFNFFPGSKRCVSIEAAADWIARLPDGIEKIAILVNPTSAIARSIAGLPGITALQLHGSETAQFCRDLKEEGIRFEKAFPATDPLLATAGQFFTDTVLLDSCSPGQFGGSGQSFDWKIARQFVSDHPELRVVLAGGLTPENVTQAIALVRPFGVDVTSGVVSAAGRKDFGRLRAFISAARGN